MEYYPIQHDALEHLLIDRQSLLARFDESEAPYVFDNGTLLIVESRYYAGHVYPMTSIAKILVFNALSDLYWAEDYCEYLNNSQLDYQVRGLGNGVVSSYELWMVVPNDDCFVRTSSRDAVIGRVYRNSPEFTTRRIIRRVSMMAFKAVYAYNSLGNGKIRGSFCHYRQVMSDDQIYLECVKQCEVYHEDISF